MLGFIRHCHFDKRDSVEIDQLIQNEFVPIIRKARVSSVTPGWIQGLARARHSASSRTRPAPTNRCGSRPTSYGQRWRNS